jgi:biopolymer transport protein ExbD
MLGPFNSSRPRRRAAINITSLIDVMFLLLIFFMVSSTFRNQLGIDLELPAARTATDQEQPPYEIVVNREGHVLWGAQPVDEAGLRQALASVPRNGKQPADVVLRADSHADFGRVIEVMDIAREVGGARLIIPTAPWAPAAAD